MERERERGMKEGEGNRSWNRATDWLRPALHITAKQRHLRLLDSEVVLRVRWRKDIVETIVGVRSMGRRSVASVSSRRRSRNSARCPKDLTGHRCRNYTLKSFFRSVSTRSRAYYWNSNRLSCMLLAMLLYCELFPVKHALHTLDTVINYFTFTVRRPIS